MIFKLVSELFSKPFFQTHSQNLTSDFCNFFSGFSQQDLAPDFTLTLDSGIFQNFTPDHFKLTCFTPEQIKSFHLELLFSRNHFHNSKTPSFRNQTVRSSRIYKTKRFHNGNFLRILIVSSLELAPWLHVLKCNHHVSVHSYLFKLTSNPTFHYL